MVLVVQPRISELGIKEWCLWLPRIKSSVEFLVFLSTGVEASSKIEQIFFASVNQFDDLGILLVREGERSFLEINTNFDGLVSAMRSFVN